MLKTHFELLLKIHYNFFFFLNFLIFAFDCRFSTGQELANLAVSSGLLAESCEKISQLYSQINHDEPIGYIVEKSNYLIIVFGTSPFRTEQLVKKQELVPSTSLPLLQFLCSDRCPSFSIHRSAVTLFPSPNRLSDLQTKVHLSVFPFQF